MIDSKTPLIIIGAGVEGRIVLDIANELDVLVYGFLTDQEAHLNQEVNDILVVAKLDSSDSNTLLSDENVKMIIAEAEIPKRKELAQYAQKYVPEIVNMIHPLRAISGYAKMGRGNIVQAGASLQANVLIGGFNIIGSHVIMEPDSAIGDFCTLQSGVQVGQGAQIHNEVFVGAGAVIYREVNVGEGAIIGAGSVVLQEVPPGATVFGNPAKVVGES